MNVEEKCPPNHTMAPCNGTTSTPPKVGHPPPQLQWHPAMAPRPLPPKLAVTLPFPHHSTLQWHPAMAPRPLPQSWSSPSPTIAHYNGTLRGHPAMAPRPLHPAIAPWCHVQSAKVVRRPHPLLEVRTPIAIAIWGKTLYKGRFGGPILYIIYNYLVVFLHPSEKYYIVKLDHFCRDRRENSKIFELPPPRQGASLPAFLVGAHATPLISDRTGERRKHWVGAEHLHIFAHVWSHFANQMVIPRDFTCHDSILGGEVDPTRNPTKCHDSPHPQKKVMSKVTF